MRLVHLQCWTPNFGSSCFFCRTGSRARTTWSAKNRLCHYSSRLYLGAQIFLDFIGRQKFHAPCRSGLKSGLVCATIADPSSLLLNLIANQISVSIYFRVVPMWLDVFFIKKKIMERNRRKRNKGKNKQTIEQRKRNEGKRNKGQLDEGTKE